MTKDLIIGRRRCGIPEHRRQIRYLQRWCAFLQSRHSEMWARNRELQKELYDLKYPRIHRFRFTWLNWLLTK